MTFYTYKDELRWFFKSIYGVKTWDRYFHFEIILWSSGNLKTSGHLSFAWIKAAWCQRGLRMLKRSALNRQNCNFWVIFDDSRRLICCEYSVINNWPKLHCFWNEWYTPWAYSWELVENPTVTQNHYYSKVLNNQNVVSVNVVLVAEASDSQTNFSLWNFFINSVY